MSNSYSLAPGEVPALRPLRSAWPLELKQPVEPGLVSVVIPTYNRSHIVGRAIESALAQTYPSMDVIVVDDGSTDETRQVVESFGTRVTYLHQPNAGVSAARNTGLRYARGEFIAFLDSDDEWQPWKIDAEILALESHPQAGIVWTDMQSVDDTGNVVQARHLRTMYGAYANLDLERTLPNVKSLGALGAHVPDEVVAAPVRCGDLFSAILLGNLIHTSTVLFRRSWVERTGGFDESSRTGEDYEFYIRLCSAGPVIFIDAPSTVYRVGASDRLTRPSLVLEIARNNLRAIEKWIPMSSAHVTLPRTLLRRRLAESLAWVGDAELDAGHRFSAAGRLCRSLATMPRVDRRWFLLARCCLPQSVSQELRFALRAFSGPAGSQRARPAPDVTAAR